MKIGIIGMGLMGGSMARAIKAFTPHTVLGADCDAAAVAKAQLLDAIDGVLDEKQFSELDMLVIAISPAAAIEEMKRCVPLLKDGATVIDIAGVKADVCNSMKELSASFPNINFIATHPMAGREFSGISYSKPNLFKGASALVIPVECDIYSMSELKRLFLSLGFLSVKFTSAEYHDKMIAYTSQLPHLISSAYIQSPLAPCHDGFSAGSFSDLSRVARINADMWTELFLSNSQNVLTALDVMGENLARLRALIADGDAEGLKSFLEKGNAAKQEADKCSRRWKSEEQAQNTVPPEPFTPALSFEKELFR